MRQFLTQLESSSSSSATSPPSSSSPSSSSALPPGITGGGEDTTKALEELLGKATKMVAMSEAYLRQVHTITPTPS
jgi:hypothetical protein